MKIINILIFLLFALFTGWQFNDPDSFIWVTIYGVVSLIAILKVFGIFQRNMVFLIMVALGLYALVHAPYFWEWLTTPNKNEIVGEMVYKKPYIEGTREFLGLVIADLSLAFHLYWKKGE